MIKEQNFEKFFKFAREKIDVEFESPRNVIWKENPASKFQDCGN